MLDQMPEEWEESYEMLEQIHAEAEILTPFYDLHELSSNLSIQVPKRDKILDAIHEKRVSCCPNPFFQYRFQN